jgi:cation diffusion facilitator CzcD-associated flavoprotein CzcO
MYTLGYSFRPWTEAKAIADGHSILTYIRDTAREFAIEDKIRLNHRVTEARWDSAQARWSVQVQRTDIDAPVTLTCSFLYVCSGYYRYDEGYRPDFPGATRFTGPIVHPQHWPEDLDYAGKRVVVIGSGATAVTLVPSMAGTAAHVTMLQRSPTYIASLPAKDPLADWLRGRANPAFAYSVVRWKNVLLGMASFQLSRRVPRFMKALLRRGAASRLPSGFDIDRHLTPSYNPWDQRLCLVPDGDLFQAISDGSASIVTDHIDTFTEHGIRLRSGASLDADVIITATGLNVLVAGGIRLWVDGEPVDLADTMSYKGMMLSGVPNFVWTVGYTNASWTLKADLVAEYVCRLLNHMTAHGHTTITPVPPATPAATPLIDLTSGYVQRALATLPKQGSATPWRLHHNYIRDLHLLRRGPLTDDVSLTGTPAQHNPVATPSGS